MNKGILLIALGHPYYGRMALNMAVSLKVTDPTCKIALVYNDSSITHLSNYDLKPWFDKMIKAPDECYHTGKKETYIKAKVWMYDLSPFEETIFLDVDAIWTPWRPISKLFDELKDLEWTMANRDHFDLSQEHINEKYSIWCNIKEVKEKYGIGKYYSLHSEFVYFKKTEGNKKYFDTAKEVFNNCKVYPANFAGSIPDELPFAISCILNDKYPHIEPFLPSFWGQAEKNSKLSLRDIYETFYIYSIGGNITLNKWKDIYNNLARWYFNKARLQFPYQVMDKKRFLKERQNV